MFDGNGEMLFETTYSPDAWITFSCQLDPENDIAIFFLDGQTFGPFDYPYQQIDGLNFFSIEATYFVDDIMVQTLEFGCMDSLACNYNPAAIEDDGSCAEIDECGVCGGQGVHRKTAIAMETLLMCWESVGTLHS